MSKPIYTASSPRSLLKSSATSPRVKRGRGRGCSQHSDVSSLSRRLLEAAQKETCDLSPKPSTATAIDFTRLISLFQHPVYGGQDLIIRKYLSYKESRQECADVGSVWRGDESTYSDYMPPPHLPLRAHRDWLFSSVFYVALDDEADIFPDKLQKLLMTIAETRNQAIFSSYSQALRVLHCLHLELRCPAELHAKFWICHSTPSSGNFASVISRITRLAESR